jgi:hypothetical protein
VVRRGGAFDRWDLEVRGGALGTVRALLAVEEHGAGRQLLRARTWPRLAGPALGAALLGVGLAAGAALAGAWLVEVPLAATAAALTTQGVRECAAAAAAARQALGAVRRDAAG